METPEKIGAEISEFITEFYDDRIADAVDLVEPYLSREGGKNFLPVRCNGVDGFVPPDAPSRVKQARGLLVSQEILQRSCEAEEIDGVVGAAIFSAFLAVDMWATEAFGVDLGEKLMREIKAKPGRSKGGKKSPWNDDDRALALALFDENLTGDRSETEARQRAVSVFFNRKGKAPTVETLRTWCNKRDGI